MNGETEIRVLPPASHFVRFTFGDMKTRTQPLQPTLIVFNCDQSWIKSYLLSLLCYFWWPFQIILETKNNWKSSLGDQPPGSQASLENI